ncbi:MAG: hypothetical protein COA74_01030 [Gammaproteobacteria bacterium]|nr:MAG: hypothetical protein COA74_01030 [Gammaproteobacteria bacterium]
MPYSLRIAFERFEKETIELERLVTELATHPESIERDTHIEGCFIRMVVNWEVFIEEYFLRCMCKARTRSKYLICPRIVASKNINEAFKKINKYRNDRDKDYTNWLDVKLVQQRIDDHFRKNSRVQKICESPDKMFELKVIRNAIAHRSTFAIAKFEKYVKDQMGYLSVMKPTMATLLVQRKRNSRHLIFTLLSSYFHGLASRLTK